MTIPRSKVVELRNRFQQISNEWNKRADEYNGPCPETHYEYCMMADAYRISMLMVDQLVQEYTDWQEVPPIERR